MKNKDIRNLVIIWIMALVLAVATGLVYFVAWHGNTSPKDIHTPITSWFTAPATTLAEKVRGEAAWTMTVILPFFYGPIMTLFYIVMRFGKAKNPIAAKFHENVPLEVFWSVTPAFFLVAMSIPAFGVLAFLDKEPDKVDQVVDVTGYQYYWQYNFPKYGVTVTDDGTGKDPLVLPVNKNIMLYGQSPQVNHAWWVPAFGLKFDVIPGRINRGWIRPVHEGFFKGQCAELCGTLHAYMWIHVKVVPEKEFYEWLIDKGATFSPEDIDEVEQVIGRKLEAPDTKELIPAAT